MRLSKRKLHIYIPSITSRRTHSSTYIVSWSRKRFFPSASKPRTCTVLMTADGRVRWSTTFLNTLITSENVYEHGLSYFCPIWTKIGILGSVYLSIYPPIHPSIHLLSIYLPTYLPTYIHTYLPTYLPTCLPTYLPTYLPIYLRACLPTYLPIYISACLPVCLT